ncbi:GlsB/YeaQ/YmgE family stress response membrane protein [Tsuneonella amylolytica]|uniref:GlsB/YeaQ/YmgE family stress response membrane protein n=1 Tax=Tsuneonella amylolytica TaxID=2338327 RepID=UPI000EA952D5|nr:GlsB/YeaQ/YmgE family stress response membrane protein [Tsuneonella amylolytica]
MGFVVLMAVGAILGWSASILTCNDEGRDIALNMGVGVIAALVAGALFSAAPLALGLTATALLAAIAVSVAVLGGFNAARMRMAR